MHVVFEEIYSGLAEHAAPVMRQLQQRNHNVVIACHASERDVYNKLIDNGFYSGKPKVVTFDDWSWDCRIDALFSVVPGSPGPLLRDTEGPTDIIRAAMPHGLTDKANKFPAHFIGHPLGYFNVLLASGPAMFDGSWKAYVGKHPQTIHQLKIINAGVPKTDALFDNTYHRTDILQTLGLDASKKTVLYAPTFHRETSLEQHGLQILEQLGRLDCNLLVRLHHLSLSMDNADAIKSHGGKNWRNIIKKLESKYPNLRMVEGDSTPCFVAADLMVSDVSGAAFEFIVQDKPVVFIDAPDFFAINGKGGVAYTGRNAGIIVSDINKLGEQVAQQSTAPELKARERRALISKLIYRCGKAAGYVADTLESLHRSGDFSGLGPRLNLQTDCLLNEYIIERIKRAFLEHGEQVLLYGAGQHTNRLLKLCERERQSGYSTPAFKTILDDNISLRSINGIPVIRPSQLKIPPECIILSTDYYQTEMRERVVKYFGGKTEIIDLYKPFPWYHPDNKTI